MYVGSTCVTGYPAYCTNDANFTSCYSVLKLPVLVLKTLWYWKLCPGFLCHTWIVCSHQVAWCFEPGRTDPCSNFLGKPQTAAVDFQSGWLKCACPESSWSTLLIYQKWCIGLEQTEVPGQLESICLCCGAGAWSSSTGLQHMHWVTRLEPLAVTSWGNTCNACLHPRRYWLFLIKDAPSSLWLPCNYFEKKIQDIQYFCLLTKKIVLSNHPPPSLLHIFIQFSRTVFRAQTCCQIASTCSVNKSKNPQLILEVCKLVCKSNLPKWHVFFRKCFLSAFLKFDHWTVVLNEEKGLSYPGG